MTEAVKFSGRMLSFSMVTLTTNDLSRIKNALTAKLTDVSEPIPVVLDSEVAQDLAKLLVVVRDAGLHPIAVVDGSLTEQARLFKLATFPQSMKVQKVQRQNPQPEPRAEVVAAASVPVPAVPKAPQMSATMVHAGVLRSGQSISNPEGDLVMVNGVNNGSEAIAAGSLHVYGKAQGRLVAGAAGDESAMVFCQHLEPTLISIAGVYCLPDGIPEALKGQAVFIKYEKDTGLVFTAMNPALQ